MDIQLTKQIVALTDEKNYLRNIQEEADECGLDVETVILNRIERIYEELAKLEG